MRKIIAAVFWLAALVAAAFAQIPPPVPALPDSQRLTTYSISGSTCACSVGFALYGDGTDYGNWIDVYLNGVNVASTDPTYGWVLSSPSGPLGSISLPITNAIITFNSAQTGTVNIVGARRPRRLSQYTEGRGVPARDLNVAITDLVAENREQWDALNATIHGQPGEVWATMPLPSARAGLLLCFAAGTGLPTTCTGTVSTSFAAGTGISFSGVNPTTVATNLSAGNGLTISGSNPQTIGTTDTEHSLTTTYSVVTTDCGARLLAGGSAFYTVTFPAASGFAAGCKVTVTNTDAGNFGKTLSVNGLTNGGFNLDGCGLSNICPGQTAEYISTGSSWVLTRNPGPWRPTANPNLYVSTVGSNTNDCLSTSTPCTLAFACMARASIDTGGDANNGAIVTINLADGTYTGSNGANLCAIQGNAGGQSSTLTLLAGDCGSPLNVNLQPATTGTALFTKDVGEVQLDCMLLNTAGSTTVLISGAQFSVVDILQSVTFGCAGTGGVDIQLSQSASMNIVNSYSKLGPCNQNSHIYASSNANILASNNNPVITVTGALTLSGAFMYTQGAHWELGTLTTSFAAGSVVGTAFGHYSSSSSVGTQPGGCIHTNNRTLQSLIGSGTLIALPVTTCADFPTVTNFSFLPTCGANNEGAMYAVADGSTATFNATLAGGGSNHVIAYCNKTNYVVH